MECHAKQESVQWLLPGAVRLSCVLRFKSLGPVSKLLFGETSRTHLQEHVDRAAEADNGNVDEVYRLLKCLGQTEVQSTPLRQAGYWSAGENTR